MKVRFRSALVILLIAFAALCGSGPARAFDTGPHFDMTRDALTAEGFGDVAVRVIQINNWFCDLYEQDTSNAFSGHQSWGSFKGAFANLLTLFRKEDWPQALVDAAEKLHFDSSNPIDNYAQAQAEWYRLARKTREMLREHARRGDLEGMLAIMGMTLHGLQDFYTHSNWVEPKGDRRVIGGSGPGWAAIRTYGTHPTFFDVPESVRATHNIYSRQLPAAYVPTAGTTAPPPAATPRPPRISSGTSTGNPSPSNAPGGVTVTSRPRPSNAARIQALKKKFPFFRDAQGREIRDHRASALRVGHGGWDSPSSGTSLTELSMNKDSINRPYYEQAYTTAYIASRQWIQAMRSWIADEALWARLKQFANTHGGDLAHDQKGAFELSWHVGHWNGNEGGQSNKVDIGAAGIRYFDGRSKTAFRRKFETLATEIVKPPLTNEEAPVPSSRPIALDTSFVVVRVTKWQQIEGRFEVFDIDDGTQADYFMDAVINGQHLRSCIINGKDSFTFPPPYAPVAFIKAVPSTSTSVSVRLLLMEDDLVGGNEQADINPAKNSKELRLAYNPKTAVLSGDVSGIGTKKSVGQDGNKGEITFRVETMPVVAGQAPGTTNLPAVNRLQQLQLQRP